VASFDELNFVPSIRLQMRKLRLEILAMKKEKSETRKMVEDLKQQMILGLQSAVNKTQNLQKQLDAVTAEKQKLEEQLLKIRREDKKAS
jgi:hypothetical protein